jgi:hypothetical protein
MCDQANAFARLPDSEREAMQQEFVRTLDEAGKMNLIDVHQRRALFAMAQLLHHPRAILPTMDRAVLPDRQHVFSAVRRAV